MKDFLDFDRYFHILLIALAVLGVLGMQYRPGSYYTDLYGQIFLASVPVWHVLSFLIRLFLPYPKTQFFKVYSYYLLLCLVATMSIFIYPAICLYCG